MNNGSSNLSYNVSVLKDLLKIKTILKNESIISSNIKNLLLYTEPKDKFYSAHT